LLRGLPVSCALAVLAHEYTHLWQRQHCPRQVHELVEGLAMWVETQVLEALGEPWLAAEAEFSLERGYGSGVRELQSLEMRVGRQGVLAWVRQARFFPPGSCLVEAWNYLACLWKGDPRYRPVLAL